MATRILGEVWRPTGVASDWAPYRWGKWEHSSRGWSWVSHEPWGWATYHYGRWYLHERLGWFWVPGQEWSPAWVIWRRDAEAVGWAPLPPPGLRVFSPAWTFIPANRLGEQVERVMVAGPRLPALLLRMRGRPTLSSEPPPAG